MVIYLDIDKYLEKEDFYFFYDLGDDLNWPWQSTHFLLTERCHGCRHFNFDNLPLHFVMYMTNEDIRILLESTFFWCHWCNFTVYDHYPLDECNYCN